LTIIHQQFTTISPSKNHNLARHFLKTPAKTPFRRPEKINLRNSDSSPA
jgi:hypothetical protein